MTEQIPAVVAATYFDALGRGDVPTAMAQLGEAAVWHQPGANRRTGTATREPLTIAGPRFSGDHLGVEGIGALLGGMMEASQGSFQLAVAGQLSRLGHRAPVARQRR